MPVLQLGHDLMLGRCRGEDGARLWAVAAESLVGPCKREGKEGRTGKSTLGCGAEEEPSWACAGEKGKRMERSRLTTGS